MPSNQEGLTLEEFIERSAASLARRSSVPIASAILLAFFRQHQGDEYSSVDDFAEIIEERLYSEVSICFRSMAPDEQAICFALEDEKNRASFRIIRDLARSASGSPFTLTPASLSILSGLTLDEAQHAIKRALLLGLVAPANDRIPTQMQLDCCASFVADKMSIEDDPRGLFAK